jgi:hypothetical protein
MTIELAGVTLPDLIIEDEFSWSGVESRVEFSLSGRPVVAEQEIFGKPIDLVGTDKSGWIDRATLIALQNLAKVPMAEYELTYGTESKTVRFRNEEPPVIFASPIAPSPDQENEDRYNNLRIKLMEAT